MRNTLALVEEFLNPSEAIHIRRNASTALGAIAADACEEHRRRSQAGMERLALMARSDPSKEVRDHAAEALHRAAADNPRAVEAAVQALSRTGKAEERRRAYALLGWLRADGLAKAPRGVAARLRRLGLLASIKCLPDTEAKVSIHWRPAWLAALGALAGAFALALLAYIRVSFLDPVVVPALLIFSPLLGAVLAGFAAQRSIPAGWHYDRLAGGLVTIFRTLKWTALPACLLAFMIVSIVEPDKEWVAWFASAFGLLIVVALVRLGSLLAYGITTRPWTALGIHAVAGTAFGLIVVMAMAWWHPFLLDDYGWKYAIHTSWAILSPALVGVGVAFAEIERRSVPPRRMAGWVSTLVVLLSVAVCGFLLGHPLFPPDQMSIGNLEFPVGHDGPWETTVSTARDQVYRADSVQTLSSDAWFPIRRLDGDGEPTANVVDDQARTNSVQAPEMKLGDDGYLQLLAPGRYRLRPTKARFSHRTHLGNLFPRLYRQDTPDGSVRRVSLAFNPLATQEILQNPRDPFFAGSQAAIAAVWKINRVPFLIRFRIDSPRHILASLPERGTRIFLPDLTLTLMDDQGKEIAEGDDPPRLSHRLSAPGEYVLVADLYGRERGERTTRSIKLMLILSVDEDSAATAPE